MMARKKSHGKMAESALDLTSLQLNQVRLWPKCFMVLRGWVQPVDLQTWLTIIYGPMVRILSEYFNEPKCWTAQLCTHIFFAIKMPPPHIGSFTKLASNFS